MVQPVFGFAFCIYVEKYTELETVVSILLPGLREQIGRNLSGIDFVRMVDSQGEPLIKWNVRVQVESEEQRKTLLERSLAWAKERFVGYTIGEQPLYRQLERYGGEEVLQRVEDFFTASSLLAAELFAKGDAVLQKVGFAFWLNKILLYELELGQVEEVVYVRAVGETWHNYYQTQAFHRDQSHLAIVSQLIDNVEETQLDLREFSHFSLYMNAVKKIREVAWPISRANLSEAPEHSQSLRAFWETSPSAESAFAQLVISLMHMNFNKFGIIGVMEIAMYEVMAVMAD